jgi:hypothetical protein
MKTLMLVASLLFSQMALSQDVVDAFKDIPSEAVENAELDTISGKGGYYAMYQGQVVSASSLGALNRMFPTAKSITTAAPSTWGKQPVVQSVQQTSKGVSLTVYSPTTIKTTTSKVVSQPIQSISTAATLASKVSTATSWLAKTGKLKASLTDIQKIQIYNATKNPGMPLL